MRKCTEEDWVKFPPPAKKDAKFIGQLREQGIMHCFSDKDGHGKEWRHNKIFGTFFTKARYLGVEPKFCHPRGTPNIYPLIKTDQFIKLDWCRNYTVGDMEDE